MQSKMDNKSKQKIDLVAKQKFSMNKQNNKNHNKTAKNNEKNIKIGAKNIKIMPITTKNVNDDNRKPNTEKQKEKDISGKTELDFSKPKIASKSVVAILLVFVISLLSITSVLIAQNIKSENVIKADATNTRIVQAKLSALGYFNSEIDGVYDKETIDAIKSYQQDKNLAVTGNLDSATTTALGVTDNAQANSDLYLLAKLIYSEARGEIYQGQVAVGAVVLNRVNDAGFPNTLQGVIYQPWAFTALHDGQFALEPNGTAYQAAQDAMNGWDPTYGCLYYYNPKTATSSWIFSRQIAVTIGNHVFCY